MLPFYLDPSSGSILLQLLIAALAGIGIAIASSWQKLKKLFRKGGKSNVTEINDEEQDE
jgi:hypothetical protein